MTFDSSESQLQEPNAEEGAPIPSIPPGLPAETPGKRGYSGFIRRLALTAAASFILGVLAGGAAIWLSHKPAPPPPLMRFVMELPRTAPLALNAHPLALSSDGTCLAYVAQVDGDTQLYVRTLDQIEATPISGTRNAISPFFAPNGTWIGYFDARDSTLKKVARSGGDPVVLCKAQFGLGASWGTNDAILFAPDSFSGLWRIPAAGGSPEPLTQLQEKELSHRWPEILPDARTAIFTISMGGTASATRIAAVSLKTGQRQVLLEDASDAHYLPTGHLLFLRGSDLMAVGFDAARLEVHGEPFLVRQAIATDKAAGAGRYACSSRGILAYVPADEVEELRTLAWADRQGGVERLAVTQGAFSYPRLSPDGRMLAVIIHSQEGQANLWTVDVANGTFARLTSEANSILPVWTPDSLRVTFASDREGQWNLFWMPADGSHPAELLHKSANPLMPNAWSSDGNTLIFTEVAPKTGPDIWTLSMADGGEARPFLHTQSAEWGGTFSPDGRWLAYTSDESGPLQVYVRPFPGPGEPYQISTAEGREPVWGRDGRELFFRYFMGLLSAGIQTDPDFNSDPPRLVVAGDYITGEIPVFPNYDVSADGQHFVLIPREPRERRQINIDLNWFAKPLP
jgi:Tol biopolymer transport system component